MEFRGDILRAIQDSQQPDDLLVAKAMNDIAECYTFYGKYEDAKDMRLQILEQFDDQFRKVRHLPADISLQRIYMKILEGLARDYTKLADDYRQSPGKSLKPYLSLNILTSPTPLRPRP
jgi:hypothetical protein